jgi:DNA-binding transcriptional ArsR family regulator
LPVRQRSGGLAAFGEHGRRNGWTQGDLVFNAVVSSHRFVGEHWRGGHLRHCASGEILGPVNTTAPVAATDQARAALIGRALADPKRLCVLETLAAGEASVSELSSCVGCQVPNMSQHLAVLRSAGLVTTWRDGSTVYYRLADPKVLEAYRLIQVLAR